MSVLACSCGEDHSQSPAWKVVLAVVAKQGELLEMTVNGRSWKVPRTFIAMHGIKGAELPWLAARYGWQEV